MSDYQRLKRKLTGKPYLVADLETEEIYLATKGELFQLMTTDEPFPERVTLHLAGSLEGFAKLDGVEKDDREFGSPEIAKIAGFKYQVTYKYIQLGIFVPSIREATGSGKGAEKIAIFSWQDAFIAGVIGCLKRHGLSLEMLKKVRSVFVDDQPKQKQTAAKPAISERS